MLFEHATRNLFFTGKGGVGKTTTACATAVQLAIAGKRVLLVSTDPASNLDEVLSTPLGTEPTSVRGLPTLFAMNIDPEAAAAEYRERMVGPYRGVLPDVAVASMEEQFSGSCTVEIAAFDQFAQLLGEPSTTQDYDHVIFDTAPTGHTLRLLTLPSAWSEFLEENTSGTSCVGPLAGLQKQQAVYAQTAEALRQAQTTTLVLVSRPETSALAEAGKTADELRELGVENQHLIINGLFEATDVNDPVALAMQKRGQSAIAEMPESLQSLKQRQIPLSARAVMGIDALAQLGSAEESVQPTSDGELPTSDLPASFGPLIDQLSAKSKGVVLAMGKGGVGKTTVACAVAVELAQRGHAVRLTTTDPAAHVAATLAQDALPNLTVGRIDPGEETEKYRNEVRAAAGDGLDEQGRALLEEDLRSPCTEEIAVFRAFADAVAEGEDGFVVLDTAPTGHTILLLDSALAFHKEVSRQTSQVSDSVENLLPRLRDPEFTNVLVVTLPEATPVHEAAALQEDLLRAGIKPTAWVVNQSLLPLTVHDPILKQRQLGERKYVDEAVEQSDHRTHLIPWLIEPPTGLEGLRQVAESSNPACC
ncbi:Arsenical pump-driving ATPase [Stieleria bergensis]|uniref:arsenite-transporting ATPase n=1 Tax=Stieleria bergensis TaxID=2528025 RepID=A0A517SUV1_9BACT|nr:Arsenical pump-driving ATPase [Planctomycetes bacterium SV_7m_r]